MSSTRASLLAAIKNPKDRSAQRQFVEHYRPFIVSTLLRAGLADPDDVAQDVLLKILQITTSPRWQYDPNRSFRAYLRVTVHRAFIDAIRGPSTRGAGGSSAARRLNSVAAPRSLAAAQVDELIDVEDEVARQLEGDAYREAERRVKCRVEPKTWQLFLLWKRRRKQPNARGKRLAARLRMKENTVHAAWSRVRRMIRAELAKGHAYAALTEE